MKYAAWLKTSGSIVCGIESRDPPILPDDLECYAFKDDEMGINIEELSITHRVDSSNGGPSLVALSPQESAALAAPTGLKLMHRERDAALDETAWTIGVDSPLTEECKALFIAWRRKLHRWMVDYPNGDVALPERPTLEYMPLTEQV